MNGRLKQETSGGIVGDGGKKRKTEQAREAGRAYTRSCYMVNVSTSHKAK